MSEPGKYTIRPCRDSDFVTLRRLIHDTIDISYAAAYPPRAVAFFKSFHGQDQIRARNRDGTVLVIDEDNTLTATGSVVDNEIFAVFVHPDKQGGGRGRALMMALEELARRNGIAETELSVSLPSYDFYRGLGYEIVEKRSRDVGEGQCLDYWMARKPL